MTYKSTFAITATDVKQKSKVYWCHHIGWVREDHLPKSLHFLIHQYKTESSARWVMKTFMGPWTDLYKFKIEQRVKEVV